MREFLSDIGTAFNLLKRREVLLWLLAVFIVILLGGCGKSQETPEEPAEKEQAEADIAEQESQEEEVSGFAGESGQDAHVDFTMLKEKNPDIFAWIYIPDTNIDHPILQSMPTDDFYISHNAYGEEDPLGAVYIELANMTNMCDFNTVIHGSTGTDESGLFADLYQFLNPDFFKDHEQVYLYLDGNALVYEVFAAYERENTSLIRTYDFTYLSGCQQFLDDLYTTRDLSMNLREGWEGVNSYNFLITLTTQKEENAEKQLVIVAVLTQDAAGTISGVVRE